MCCMWAYVGIEPQRTASGMAGNEVLFDTDMDGKIHDAESAPRSYFYSVEQLPVPRRRRRVLLSVSLFVVAVLISRSARRAVVRSLSQDKSSKSHAAASSDRQVSEATKRHPLGVTVTSLYVLVYGGELEA